MKNHGKRDSMVLSGNLYEIYTGEYIESFVNCLVKYNYEFFLPKISKGTECDLIVITKGGVYCIECKNYYSMISGKEYSIEWTFISSGKKNKVSNPVLANSRHVRAIQGLLYKNNLGNLGIKSLVCVPDTCKIHSECKEVMNLTSVVNLIREESLVSKIDMKETSRLIDSVCYKIRR